MHISSNFPMSIDVRKCYLMSPISFKSSMIWDEFIAIGDTKP